MECISADSNLEMKVRYVSTVRTEVAWRTTSAAVVQEKSARVRE